MNEAKDTSENVERDRVTIEALHEVVLAHRLGYSVFCTLDGVPGELVVDDGRQTEHFEVLTIYGWRRPLTCWAIGPDAETTIKPGLVSEQRGLFG